MYRLIFPLTCIAALAVVEKLHHEFIAEEETDKVKSLNDYCWMTIAARI